MSTELNDTSQMLIKLHNEYFKIHHLYRQPFFPSLLLNLQARLTNLTTEINSKYPDNEFFKSYISILKTLLHHSYMPPT